MCVYVYIFKLLSFFSSYDLKKLKAHRKANMIISKNSHSVGFDVYKLYLYIFELCAVYLQFFNAFLFLLKIKMQIPQE